MQDTLEHVTKVEIAKKKNDGTRQISCKFSSARYFKSNLGCILLFTANTQYL